MGEQGNEEDAFPKNGFSSRVMVRGRGLKEEVRGLREPPCRPHRSPSPRHSGGYYNSRRLDLNESLFQSEKNVLESVCITVFYSNVQGTVYPEMISHS